VLYRHSEVFRTVMMGADLVLVVLAWVAAYALRFHAGIPAPLGVPDFDRYLEALLVICPLWWWLLRRHGLYEAKRLESIAHEAIDVFRVAALALVLLVAITFFVRSYFYSRGVVALFSVLAPVLIVALRVVLRLTLRRMRRRGYNLRFVLVVGTGELASAVIERIHAQPSAGLRVEGVVGDRTNGATIAGVPRLGGYEALKQVMAERRVDQVIIALSREHAGRLDDILLDLDDEVASVKLAPDLMHIMTLRSSVESLDGLPIISLRDSPLVGWASVQKRALDVIASALLLVLMSPLMLLIGAAVWITSGRPILYRQRRMGLDGNVFDMIKFRSMHVAAEPLGEAGWTVAEDPRRTKLGRRLRRFGLDELPQLWNVLKGDMSLVGPRPERPVYIETFRREIPGYMLRHKVKAGVTGWAQVHGWRGDTSLHERVEHDIFYIQNWSMGLDLRILVMTLWRGVVSGENAY
jgi:Undecaprenyl-phosphate glucose phosphotransferase